MSMGYRKSSLVSFLTQLKVFILKRSLIFCLLLMGNLMHMSFFGQSALVPRNLLTHRRDRASHINLFINRLKVVSFS
jgi:hypothetical protein